MNSLKEAFSRKNMLKNLNFFGELNLGLILTAVGIVYFKNPNHFAFGGTSGLSILLADLFPKINVGGFMWIINLILVVLGFVFLGIKTMGWTIYSSFALSFFVSVCEWLYPVNVSMSGDAMLDYKHTHMPENKNDVLSNFCILPLFHLGTFICLFSWPFKGWALNLCSDLRNFYRDLGLMHSDSIAVAPVLMESIYKDVKRGRADKLNGLWNPCGSPATFDSALLLGLVENGMYITQCYGMTETCGDGLVNYAQAEPHIRALGKPDGHCEYKLDETTGEICIRGGCVMLGYYKDPEATAEIIDKDGWLHTGDLAREDEEGYYYMVGRKKNLIILGTGENVSPEELERKLNACPEVQECVVKEMGKKIGALICCAEEKQAEVRAFITGLNRTLPLYQRITAVEFSTEPLPRNAMGKLLRR